AGREFGGAGGGDAFAFRVAQGGEFEGDVAGVLDDDLVFDFLSEFTGFFGGAVGDFALDALLLFDRERRFGGHFGGDFDGGLGGGAFVAFDRGFVGVGADGEHVAAGDALFFPGQEFGGP